MRIFRRSCAAICVLITAVALSNTETPKEELFGTTSSAQLQPIEIELSGPISTLIKHSDQHNKQYPFTLKTDASTHKIKVKARGKSRLEVCDFPPLRLNFSKKDSKKSLFKGQDKIKLVTKCANPIRNDSDTLFEYAAYKIFSIITDVSYRVRSVQVDYLDSDNKLKPGLHHQWGFLIEPDEGVEQRLGLTATKLKGVSLAKLDKTHMAEVYLFQYLIGNTDWSLVTPTGSDKCCHNGDIFSSENGAYYLPFDFDMAGLVNTKYARPDPSLKIRRVVQRQYRGFCMSDEFLLKAIVKINALKPRIFEVLNALPNVSEKKLKSKLKFLEKYFKQSSQPQELLRFIQKRCLS